MKTITLSLDEVGRMIGSLGNTQRALARLEETKGVTTNAGDYTATIEKLVEAKQHAIENRISQVLLTVV